MPFIRRNYPRITLKKPISVNVEVNGTILHNAIVNNICMGGMCITIEGPIEKHQTGSLELMHECDNEELSFRAKFSIRWVKPAVSSVNTWDFGVKFTSIDPIDLQNLGRIIVDYMKNNSNENVSALPV